MLRKRALFFFSQTTSNRNRFILVHPQIAARLQSISELILTRLATANDPGSACPLCSTPDSTISCQTFRFWHPLVQQAIGYRSMWGNWVHQRRVLDHWLSCQRHIGPSPVLKLAKFFLSCHVSRTKCLLVTNKIKASRLIQICYTTFLYFRASLR